MTAASTYVRSAARLSRFCGVPTQTKCTRAPLTAATSVENVSRPVASACAKRSASSGSKKGASPRESASIFRASTSTPTTSCPRVTMHAAWTAPR